MYLNELLEIWFKDNYPDHRLVINPYTDGNTTYVEMDLLDDDYDVRCNVHLDRVEVLGLDRNDRNWAIGPDEILAADPLFLEKMKKCIDCRLSIFGDAIGS